MLKNLKTLKHLIFFISVRCSYARYSAAIDLVFCGRLSVEAVNQGTNALDEIGWNGHFHLHTLGRKASEALENVDHGEDGPCLMHSALRLWDLGILFDVLVV